MLPFVSFKSQRTSGSLNCVGLLKNFAKTIEQIQLVIGARVLPSTSS